MVPPIPRAEFAAGCGNLLEVEASVHRLGEGVAPENRRRSLAAWISRPESFIGICAVIVTVVAVSISAYEAGLQREWQRAAVWPYIQLNRSFYCKESSVAPGGAASGS